MRFLVGRVSEFLESPRGRSYIISIRLGKTRSGSSIESASASKKGESPCAVMGSSSMNVGKGKLAERDFHLCFETRVRRGFLSWPDSYVEDNGDAGGQRAHAPCKKRGGIKGETYF